MTVACVVERLAKEFETMEDGEREEVIGSDGSRMMEAADGK